MFSKLTTKIALKKAGIPSNVLDFSSFTTRSTTTNTTNNKTNNAKDIDPNAPASGSALAALPFANPFATLEVPVSWKSWATPAPPPVELATPPGVGVKAPSGAKLRVPSQDGRAMLVLFLRHCGCPFAEKTFIELRRLANKYPSIHCTAVSHSSAAATERWLSQIGGRWAVDVVVDEERETYALWGLGVSTSWYLLNPWTQMARQRLGTQEGNWGRDVDPTGNRWQMGGAWAVDQSGLVTWGEASKTADDMGDLVEGCRSIGGI